MTGLLQSTLWQRLSQSHQRADMQGKLAALDQVRQRVADWLAGETLHGVLWQAGLPRHARPTRAAAAV